MTAIVQRTNARSLPEDFERMFQEYHGLVYRAAYRITCNAEDAEDVLQTLFLRLLRRDTLPDFQSNPKGYLHRAAVNIALDIVRQRKRGVPPEESGESLVVDDRSGSATEAQQIVLKALAELSRFVFRGGWRQGHLVRIRPDEESADKAENAAPE